MNNVMLLIGKIGAGKTILLNTLARQAQKRMTVLRPLTSGQPLPDMDWNDCDCLAIENVEQWERSSLPATINRLESEAATRGKTLLLVLQNRAALAGLGIILKSAPASLELGGEAGSLLFGLLG